MMTTPLSSLLCAVFLFCSVSGMLVPATQKDLQWSGRVAVNGTAIEFDWGAVGVLAHFEGCTRGNVSAVFDPHSPSQTAFFNVTVNSGLPQTMIPSPALPKLLVGVTTVGASFQVEMRKRTEPSSSGRSGEAVCVIGMSSRGWRPGVGSPLYAFPGLPSGVIRFIGFEVPTGCKLVSLPAPTRRMLVIGDSLSCAWRVVA
jgi:hypothetical protein